MADLESPSLLEQQSEQQTPTKSPFQNVRPDGRAFASPNWRTKGPTDASPSRSPNPNLNTSRAVFSRPGAHVPQAIGDGRRLYVGNMPYTAKTEDVEAVFVAAEMPIERIDIAIDPFTGRNPSYCFVDLQHKEHADRAMTELDGTEMLGRPLKIKPGVTKSRTTKPQADIGRWRPQEGASFAKVNSDSSSRVYVGGLPKVTDQEIVQSNVQSFFKDFAVQEISNLFPPHPAKRFDPGDHYYLFVDLGSPEDAQRAMGTLNGQTGPWGAPLRVQYARGKTSDPKSERDA